MEMWQAGGDRRWALLCLLDDHVTDNGVGVLGGTALAAGANVTVVGLGIVMVCVVIGAAIVWMVRWGRRLAEREQRQRRILALQRGWSFDAQGSPDRGFHIAGSTIDGVRWEMNGVVENNPSGDGETDASTVWTCNDPKLPEQTLQIRTREQQAVLNKPAMRMMVKLADTLASRRGIASASEALYGFGERGHEVVSMIDSMHVGWVILTTDDALARQIITPTIAAQLQRWRDNPQLAVHIKHSLCVTVGPYVSITVSSLVADPAALETLVELGCKSARAIRERVGTADGRYR
ncbi:MAG: hypothetical protein NVSMB42_10660 [Herpetosiphon sp.]